MNLTEITYTKIKKIKNTKISENKVALLFIGENKTKTITQK